MSRPARGALVRAALSALLACGLGRSVLAGDSIAASHVDRLLGPYVRAQVLRAAARLSQEPCALVLSDYADPATGRPLAEKLVAAGESAGAYLASLTYRPAPADGPCRMPQVSAYTTPGGSVVYVCTGRFRRWQAGSDPSAPVNVLIHETLHTLGLGENPPTSEEITARVEARCGR